MSGSAFLYDAVRTPFGRYGGGLAAVRPDDLASFAVSSLLERRESLDPSLIDDVWFGNANGAGEDNRCVGRMAVLLAGVPTSVSATTVNRLCGSSLDAAMQASRAIETKDAELTLVGGVESMSRAPWVMLKPESGFPPGDRSLYSTTLGWRMVNPRMPEQWTISLGASTEKLAGLQRVGREAQDEFALRSHRLAAAAWEEGFYDPWVVRVPGTHLERDESIRPDTSIEKLSRLPSSFSDEGTVTAGNASPLSDGAAAMLLGSEAMASELGCEPLARVAARATHAVDPDLFGIAPVEAARKALARAGISWGDLRAIELNEAFAAQSLACIGEWSDVEREIVNVRGGAIAIGHPLGASGARILATLAYELRARGGGYGLAAICVGVGQGLAVVLDAR